MSTSELEHRREIDRARAPEHSRLPDRSSDHRHTSPAPDVAAEVVADLHGILGNQVLATAIAGGDLGGLEVAVGGAIGGAMAGMGASATGLFTSNQAMLRLLRSAGAVHDLVSPDPSRAGGVPLPADVRAEMEAILHHDLSGVRVHTGPVAEQEARAVAAHAFAIGDDIWFGTGGWAPGTEHGDRLLVHELTHVVQFQEGRLHAHPDGRTLSLPSDPSEREAYANEDRLAPKLAAARGAEEEAAATTTTNEASVDARGSAETAALPSPAVAASLDGAAPDGASLDGAALDGAVALARRGGAAAPEHDPARITSWITRSQGVPLPPAVAARFAAVLGHDVSHVTIHDDAAAAKAAEAVGAHAFTVGTDIFFGEGELALGTPEGDRLLAHELTHVVQHDEGRVPAAAEGLEVAHPSHALEREAEQAAAEAGPSLDAATDAPAWNDTLQLGLEASTWAASTAWNALEVARTGGGAPASGLDGPVQPGLVDAVGNAASGAWNTVTDTASAAAGAVTELGASALEALVRRVSPGLADLIARGPAVVIQGYVERAVGGFVSTMFGGADLGNIVETIQGALSGVMGIIAGAANGDTACCSAFAGWMEGLTGFVKDLLHHPVLETMRGLLQGVNDAMAKVLGLVVGPAFDLLRDLLGGAWSVVSGFAETISGWVSSVRSLAASAWDWVAEKLGLSGGEGGVGAWFANLASQAWDTIKETFAPLRGPLETIGTVLAALTPFGQVYLLYTAGQELWRVGSWLYEHWGDPDLIEKAHAELGEGKLSQLVQGMLGFGEQAKGVLTWLAEGLGSLANGFATMLGAITGIPILSIVSGLVQTISTKATSLATWVATGLAEVGTALGKIATDLWTWAQPIIEVCTSIALCIASPPMIPVVLAGWAWELLPDCFKGPIIDFLLDIIIEALEASPDLPMFGPLWVAIKPGVVGFLRNIRGQDTDTKVTISNKFAKIVRGSSLSFIFGFVKGFLKGIWEGITDPFVLAWQLLTGLGSLAGWVINLASGVMAPTGAPTGAPAGAPAGAAPETARPAATPAPAPTAPGAEPTSQQKIADKARAMWADLGPEVSTVGANFMPAIGEYFSGEGMGFDGLMEKLGELWPQLQSAISGLGGTLAQELVAFLMQDSAEGAMGEGLGWLTGTIVFEVVLFYFTAGAGTAMVEGSRILTWILRFLDWPGEALGLAFKGLAKLGGYLLDMARGLGRMMSAAGSGAVGAVMHAITNIGEKLMKWGDELFGLASRRADDVAGRAAREGAEEVGERAGREGAEELGEAGAERAGREGAEELGEEGAERTGREGAEEAGESAAERGARTEATARQAQELADDFRRQADEVLETAPPLQRQVDNVTGVTKGAEYDEAQEQLRQWYRQMEADARPVQASGTRADGPYGWEYGYEVTEFPHGVTHVQINVHLAPGAGVTLADLARVEADARVGVDRYYNFQHTITNSSGNPSRLHVEVNYVTDPAQAHLRVDVHGGAGNANLSNWYVNSDPTVHAHELGHQMGLRDEYLDAAAPNRATPTSPGYQDDQGLMTNFWSAGPNGGAAPHPNTHLPQRNLDEIAGDIRSTAPAPPTTGTTPPSPAQVGDDVAGAADGPARAPDAPRVTGADDARTRGWPDAPTGYIWASRPGGEPYLRRAAGGTATTPQVHFDAATREFVDADTGLRFANVAELETHIRVRNMARGTRPDPTTYISPAAIDAHLAHFDGGAGFITLKSNLDRFGRSRLGRPDGQFVMTRGDIDAMLGRANGDIAIIERELGIPAGTWAGQTLVRIDIPNPRGLNVRMPGGNEAGANALWLPGGRLPTGQLEAVVDQVPAGHYVETVVAGAPTP